MKEFEDLFNVVRALRDPEAGCPWDLKQTHQSLVKNAIEEVYEFIYALEKKNVSEMKEELGDVLLQVLLHSVIAEQSGEFTLEEVCSALKEKLIHRHPHVFGENKGSAKTEEEALKNWDEMKAKEKAAKKERMIPESDLYLPALMSSAKIGKKSKIANFDWDDYSQVMYKVEEEWQEVKEELPPTGSFDATRVGEEIGDLLFSIAQLTRHLGMDAEDLLRKGNEKFLKRFYRVEDILLSENKKFADLSLEEKEFYWGQAKREVK